MKKKCFVTGGAGLIGLEVCKELLRYGCEVHLYDVGEKIQINKFNIPKDIIIHEGSVLDLFSLEKKMKGCKYIFHLAAMLGVKYTEENKLECLEINCTGTKNVLTASVGVKAKKIIFASSSEVYGEPKSNPISENFFTKGKTVYGVSKIVGEEYCKSFNQEYNLKYTILRYFNTYGPAQDNKFVISKFINNIINKKPILINGNGKQLRSYMYVTDASKATVKAAFTSKTDNMTFNVGYGKKPISLKELANKVTKIINKKTKIKFDYKFKQSDRNIKREIYQRYCNSLKIQKLLKWSPKINLEEGIKRIVKNH
jgi:UDP-glucose 4-epimerase|tara:strand:- start:942 stop:1877 length:936 start_codon:yes stop_codon:yes gene_type:complete